MFRPEIRRDGRLHVRSHRLDRFLAHLGKRTMLVHHTTMLPTHSQSACFARVARTQGGVHFPKIAGFKPLSERVPYSLPASASFQSFHGEIP
jgi:hypothetical protein